jgi:threonine synthase
MRQNAKLDPTGSQTTRPGDARSGGEQGDRVTRPSNSSMTLRCSGCGAVAPAPAETGGPWPWACPQRREGDDIDHVMVTERAPAEAEESDRESDNPFIRFRRRLTSYHVWLQGGRDDQSFVALVEALDASVARVAGIGFRVTPLGRFPDLDAAIGARVWVKDETANVAGSHKGRHLFGVLLLLRVMEGLEQAAPADWAIASCGNAARVAAVLAAAGGRRLTAFVPVDVDSAVIDPLTALGAAVEACPRDGGPGDPCYRRFREAVAAGAVPFSCQGPDNGFAIEGASTLAWEVAEALPAGVDRVVVQVGGGALASACVGGFDVWSRQPIFDTVQTAGAHPLRRALDQLRAVLAAGASLDEALADAAARRSRYMWPWENEPASVARGILDDEAYDWRRVVGAMLRSDGRALVADEATLVEANRLARVATGIDVDETGSAGLAGLLLRARSGEVAGSDALVIFTGGRR